MTTSINNYLGAVGIGVSDLVRSVNFYTGIFGLKKVWKLKLPHMHEVILHLEGAPRFFPRPHALYRRVQSELYQ